MNAALFADIDWAAPWLAPYVADGQLIVASAQWREALNRIAQRRQLRNFRGMPIEFVPQASLPPGMPYESHIGATGCVPTRDNLHDFFNALVWLGFPQTKARLNQLQCDQLEMARARDADSAAFDVGNRRGALRDATTIFDENGIVFVARDHERVTALIERRWSEVFLGSREDFGGKYDVVVFGHALLEKLVRPYAAITGHCLPLIDTGVGLPLSLNMRADLDRVTASQLSPTTSNAAFFPVPVLGFPGWHAPQDEAFYANEAVFRLDRHHKVRQ